MGEYKIRPYADRGKDLEVGAILVIALSFEGGEYKIRLYAGSRDDRFAPFPAGAQRRAPVR